MLNRKVDLKEIMRNLQHIEFVVLFKDPHRKGKAWFPYDRNSRRPTATHRRRVPNQSATYGHCFDHLETRL